MQLFYLENADNLIVTLNKEDSKHCHKVLRLKRGDAISFTDGKGHLFDATIEHINPQETTAIIRQRKVIDKPWKHTIHIAIAPTKNIARTEWAIEKCSEVGIDTITPILCQHSERKEIKADRLNKIIMAALKQSLKAWLPVLETTTAFLEFIQRPFDGEKYIAHVNPDHQLLASTFSGTRNVLILIGPEGDFSQKEVDAAIANGFIPISLGGCRLRTETAMISACCITHTILQQRQTVDNPQEESVYSEPEFI